MTEYKLVVVGGKLINSLDLCMYLLYYILFKSNKAGGVGKSALTIQLIQNQ